MNLFLYVPGTSAHPTGMSKGIIHSLLRRYYEQNSNINDYFYFMRELYNNLRARAHTSYALKPIFHKAHNHIVAAAKRPSTRQPPILNNGTVNSTIPNHTNNTAIDKRANKQPEDDDLHNIILHLEYHPSDIPRKEVRRLYDQHCKELFKNLLRVQPPIIAYSRPKNIGDYVTQARLHEGPNHPASKYLGEYNQGSDP